MPAIAIELDRTTRTFTRSTAILATGLRWTGTTRILALVIVRHGILLELIKLYWGCLRVQLTDCARNRSRHTRVVLEQRDVCS